jgi:hypothetical protein
VDEKVHSGAVLYDVLVEPCVAGDRNRAPVEIHTVSVSGFDVLPVIHFESRDLHAPLLVDDTVLRELVRDNRSALRGSFSSAIRMRMSAA